ncbi:MAG: adenylate/guanylate cyclase domain-containing protein [Alphaproteobacteria bacterium]|nr:adenylate/guanylate cyclase domain-containing protein [Alphaproteobacteria bacterium]
MLDGFCERITDLGVARFHLSIAVLHPLLRAESLTWRRGRSSEAYSFPHRDEERVEWTTSPLRHMIDTGTLRLRRRLVGAEAVLDFPVLREFRDAGLTDWIALIFSFGWSPKGDLGNELGVALSIATDRPDGWAAADLSVIEELAGAFALATKATTSYGRTRDLLATYLGEDPADRVMRGAIRRGATTRLDAVILYADLRGFTRLAEATDPDVVANRLGAYLDAMGGPVEAAGGQILKFLGDGLLAVFLPSPNVGRPAQCQRALAAAQAILARIATLKAEAENRAEPTLPVDIALHEGEVLYGNVGTERRLDFTVIGRAVNEAARLEGLCRKLMTNLAISDSFRRAAGSEGRSFVALGRHLLQGVDEAREVFTVAPA